MRRGKVYSRFIVILVGGVVSPFLVISTILFGNILNEAKEQYIAIIQLVIEQNRYVLNTHVQNMYRITEKMATNEGLHRFISAHYINKNQNNYANDSEFDLRRGVVNYEAYTARIYHTNETIPRGVGDFYYLEDIMNMPSIEAFWASEDQDVWLLPGQLQDEYSANLVSTPDQYVYLKKVFINEECVYLTTVSIQESELLMFLKEHMKIDDLVEPQVVITRDKILINYKDGYRIEEKNLERMIEHRNLMITDIEGFPQKLYYIWEENNTEKLLVGILVAVFLSIFISLCFSLIYLNKFLMSLWECLEKLEQSIQSGFSDKIDIQAKGAVWHVAEAINQLIDKIQELIAVATRQTSIAKESQLIALQQQINPHFMFNTLEAFCYRMELYEHYEEADAMVAFAQMLRYNLDTQNSLTTLGEEIGQLENYIRIQMIKYKAVQLCTDIQNNLYDTVLLRFILQPFVENSIKHGYRGSPLKVIISVKVIKHYIIIKIKDDGNGIQPEKLAVLNEGLSKGRVGDGVGLSNIGQRLNLFYNGDIKIEMKSTYGVGTCVEIMLPNNLTYVDLKNGSNDYVRTKKNRG